jgi:hypothetical protein
MEEKTERQEGNGKRNGRRGRAGRTWKEERKDRRHAEWTDEQTDGRANGQ